MRSLGAWIIPLGGIAGVVVGVMVAGVLNSDCNSAFEAYWGCTRYNTGRIAFVGAVLGVLLGVLIWGPWYDDARAAEDDRTDEP